MRRVWAIWALATLAGLVGDGGSRGAPPRGGLISAAPPIPATAPGDEAERELLRGSPRRAWSAFLSRLGRRPDDLAAAVGVVEAAERTGKLETARRQLAGLRRRHDTSALRVATLELVPARGVVSDLSPFGAVKAESDAYAYVGLLRVGLAIAAGDLAAVWRAVGGLPADPGLLGAGRPQTGLEAARSRRALLRRLQLQSLLRPGRAPMARLTRLRWVARARGAHHLGARLELLQAIRSGAAADPVASSAHAAAALGDSLEEGRNSTTYMALAELRSQHNPYSHWVANRFPPRLCTLVPPRSLPLREDCRLTALEHAWKAGEFGAAMRLHDALAAEGRPAHPVLRVRFASLATPLLKTLGRLDEATVLAAQAVSDAQRLGDAGVEWRLRLHLAGMARHRGDVTAAAGWLEVPGPGVDVPAGVRVGVELERARVDALRGRVAEASRALRRAGEFARDATEVVRRLVALTRMELDGVAGSSPRAPGVPGRLLEVVDRVPVDALAAEVIRARIAEEHGDLPAARRHYRAAIRRVSEVIRLAADRGVQRGLVGAWRQLSEASARVSLELGDASGALEALVALEGSQEEALHVRQHLGSRRAVLVFRTVGGELWCWIVLEDGIRAQKVPGAPERLAYLASLWSALLQRGGEGDTWRRVGARITRTVLEPVLSAAPLRGKSRITVVARAPLASIPFDVLPAAGSGGALLGDRHVISRAGSLTLLDAAWHRPPRDGPAVAFAPRGSATVLTEVAEVLRRRRGLTFTGPQATETRFVERAAQSGLIHFGGHAVAPDAGLEGGGLVLRPTLLDDGLLSYREIVALDLRGASVVLLACDTVGGGPAPSEGTPSDHPATLAEAFLLAGSRNVVGSLWPLSEAAAGEIAEAFYSAGGPEAGPASLAMAKRTLRHRYPDSPERWAGAVWEGAPVGVGF